MIIAVVISVTVLYFQVCISSANVREANFLNSLNTSSTNNESCALISEFFNKKSKPTEEEQTHDALSKSDENYAFWKLCFYCGLKNG